jgi:hypothetical protein
MAKRYSKVFATLLLVLMATVSLAGQDSMAMTGPAAPQLDVINMVRSRRLPRR